MKGDRIVLYGRSAVGLGQLKRMLILAEALREERPDVTVLIATGSAAAHWLRWPAGVDYIKLPSLARLGDDAFGSRAPAVPVETMWALRRDILLATLEHLRPQIFVVDTFPADPDVLPVLRHLRQTRAATRIVLGLRDVVWEPELVRRLWAEHGVYGALEELYDCILVYGDQTTYDVVRESGMSAAAAAKSSYLGYVSRPPAVAPRPPRPRVVVTVGAGHDGIGLLDAVVAALRDVPDALGHDWLLVTGPLMPAAERNRLTAAASARVEVVEFVANLGDEIAGAAAIVAMGGYNTMTEILAARRPALIVPRVKPLREQLIRAEALAARGLVRLLHPDELSPGRLLAEIRALLAEPPREGSGRYAWRRGVRPGRLPVCWTNWLKPRRVGRPCRSSVEPTRSARWPWSAIRRRARPGGTRRPGSERSDHGSGRGGRRDRQGEDHRRAKRRPTTIGSTARQRWRRRVAPPPPRPGSVGPKVFRPPARPLEKRRRRSQVLFREQTTVV